jgi:hypothetical protein
VKAILSSLPDLLMKETLTIILQHLVPTDKRRLIAKLVVGKMLFHLVYSFPRVPRFGMSTSHVCDTYDSSFPTLHTADMPVTPIFPRLSLTLNFSSNAAAKKQIPLYECPLKGDRWFLRV